MTTTLILAVGDADLKDALDLNDGVSRWPEPGTFKAPPPYVRTFRSRTKGTTQTTDPYRTVTFDLFCIAGDDDALIDAVVRPIEVKLEQARAMSGPTPEDARGVCLWVSWGSAHDLVYFDVVDGALDWVRNDDKYGATPTFTVSCTFKCLPYARGRQVTYDGLAQLAIGSATSYVSLPNLPGDAPGLVQLELADDSTNAVAVDTYRVGVYALPGLVAGDYVPWVAAVPAGAGTYLLDGSAFGGQCARLTLNGSYQTLAQLKQPPAAPKLAGKLDCFLLCRDSTKLLFPPTGLTQAEVTPTVSGQGPTNSPEPCQFVVVACDADGNESLASPVISATYNAFFKWNFSWSLQGFGVPDKIRLYGFNMANSSGVASNAWWYREISGAATSFQNATATQLYAGAAGCVQKSPPISGVGASDGAIIQPLLGVVDANGQPGAFIEAPLVRTAVGSGNWELVQLGLYPLPSIATPEGQTTPTWALEFQAAYLGAGSHTLDIAAVLFFKHEAGSAEVRAVTTTAGGVPVVTLLDTNRREQSGATVNRRWAPEPTSGLIRAYVFGTGSGTTALDDGPDHENATLTAGTAWLLDPAIAGVSGASNAIVLTSGQSGSAATVGLPSGNGAYTIIAAVKTTTAAGAILSWGTGSNGTTALTLSATGVKQDWGGPNLDSSAYVRDGTWHIIAATYDGTTRRTYVDGVQVASDTPAAHAAVTSGSQLIGGSYAGAIAALRVYTRALSASEITAYQGHLPGRVGQATMIGKLTAGPGNAVVVIDANGENGVRDALNTLVTPTVRFTPRYHNVKGLTL